SPRWDARDPRRAGRRSVAGRGDPAGPRGRPRSRRRRTERPRRDRRARAGHPAGPRARSRPPRRARPPIRRHRRRRRATHRRPGPRRPQGGDKRAARHGGRRRRARELVAWRASPARDPNRGQRRLRGGGGAGSGGRRRRNRLRPHGADVPRTAGADIATEVRFGVMIEVPAAALVVDSLAPEVDFFSIGTNDLVQYTIAADRTNAALADLATPDQPALLRLIGMVCRAAEQFGRPSRRWAASRGRAASTPPTALP